MASEMSPDEIERALLRQYPGISRERARELARARDEQRPPAPSVEAPAAFVSLPLTFTLPWSMLVSDDERYGVINGRMLLRPAYREAKGKIRKLVRDLVGDVKPLALPLALHARVFVPDDVRARDVPNFAKCVHDSLQDAVYVNDRWLWDARWQRAGVDVDRPRADITITLALASLTEGGT